MNGLAAVQSTSSTQALIFMHAENSCVGKCVGRDESGWKKKKRHTRIVSEDSSEVGSDGVVLSGGGEHKGKLC